MTLCGLEGAGKKSEFVRVCVYGLSIAVGTPRAVQTGGGSNHLLVQRRQNQGQQSSSTARASSLPILRH